jgi:Ca-activated chloride channel family protein
MSDRRAGSGWDTLIVAGGAIATAVFFGTIVSVFLWLGEIQQLDGPLRFGGLENVNRLIQGAIFLSWTTGWLSFRWWLGSRERPRKGFELVTLCLSPLGLLAFVIELPEMVALVPVAIGLLAGLAALVPLTGFVKRRQLVARVGNVELVTRLLHGRSPGRRAARGILVVIGVALCAVAAARPQLHEGTRMQSRRGIDVVVVLDFSKSMLARDVPPSRIDLAKRELDQFIEGLGGDRVGLVAFAGEAIQFPLTTDYEAATMFWRDLDPYDMPVGGTAIGRALNAALSLFRNDQLSSERSKVIVLLTDGEDHEGDPVEVAREASEENIQIFVLGIGGSSPELIPQHLPDGSWSGFQRDENGEYVTTSLTEENERQLRQIAEASGGRYYRAAAGDVGVENIRREIRRLRQSQLDERPVRLYGEAYQSFLLLGLLALIVGSVLRRGRPAMVQKKEGGAL